MIVFSSGKVIKSPIATTTHLHGHWVDPSYQTICEHARDIEIQKYVQENNFQNFAIVDDMKINVYPERFIRTEDSYGLTKNLADQLIEILNS